MLSRAYSNDAGGMSLECEAADVIDFVESDADYTLDDSAPWEFLDADDDAE